MANQVLINKTTLSSLGDIARNNNYEVIKVAHSENIDDDGNWLTSPILISGTKTLFTIEEKDLPAKLFVLTDFSSYVTKISINNIDLTRNDASQIFPIWNNWGLDYFNKTSNWRDNNHELYIFEITNPGQVSIRGGGNSGSMYYGYYMALCKENTTYTPSEFLNKIISSPKSYFPIRHIDTKVSDQQYNYKSVDVLTPLTLTGWCAFDHASFISSNEQGYDFTNLKASPGSFYYTNFLEPDKIKLPATNDGYRRYGFNSSNLNSIIIPEGVVKIPAYCFAYCKNTKTVELPSTINILEERSLYISDTNLREFNVTVKNKRAEEINTGNSVFAESIISSIGTLHVYSEYLEGYKTTAPWKNFANILPYNYEDLTQIFINGKPSINIYDKSITQQYTIKYNQYDNAYQEQRGVIWNCTGPATINSEGILTLAENAQVGDTITITATSTYNNNISASLEINCYYKEPIMTIDLNSGNWGEATTATSPTSDTLYESINSYNVNKGISRARITVNGIPTFTIAIRSYGESGYDYAWITKPNQAICTDSPGSIVPLYAVLDTKNKQSASNYYTYTYTDLQDGDYIDIYYTKDGSGNNNADRGYFYIVDSGNYNITVNP